MKVLIQRVIQAEVCVEGRSAGKIGRGLVLFIGIERDDDMTRVKKMAERVLEYRVFNDDHGKMNLSVRAVQGEILAVSQFTLAADTTKGLRAGFSKAAPPLAAKQLYNAHLEALKALHGPLAEGIFGADMQISLVNDGPVTFLLEL